MATMKRNLYPGPTEPWGFYEAMYTVRSVENALLSLHAEGALSGTIHTCIGQEPCAVGVVAALDVDRDIVWSSHRGHGHFLAFTGDVEGLIAEVMGKASGVCRGVGGSQHLHANRFYTNGVLGGTVACAVGSGLAEKRKGTGAVVAVFHGDGAYGEGVTYESLNMASLWQLPVLFVLEHNGYSQSTPTHLAHATDLAARPPAFAIETVDVVAHDVREVHAAAVAAVARIRATSAPQCLVLRTYRLGPHSKGDDHRPEEELEEYRSRDPLVALRAELVLAESARVAAIEQRVSDLVAAAVEQARDQPELAIEDLVGSGD